MEAIFEIEIIAGEGERMKNPSDKNEYKLISFAKFAENDKEIDKAPGIYQILTESGAKLKVGISNNLRKRLKQHAASRDSGLEKKVLDPTEPAHLTSKGSILAKHLYFDRDLTGSNEYDLTREAGRNKYLADKCYISFLVTTTRDEARELEKPLEKSGDFRYARKVRKIKKQ